MYEDYNLLSVKGERYGKGYSKYFTATNPLRVSLHNASKICPGIFEVGTHGDRKPTSTFPLYLSFQYDKISKRVLSGNIILLS